MRRRVLELQLVGQVLADQGEDFVAGHDSSGTLATASDDAAAQRARRGQPGVGAPGHVLAHAAGRDLDRAR